MHPKLLSCVAAIAVGCAGALAAPGVSSADPVAPPSPVDSLPIDGLQAPGMPAMEQLSPVLQQAAADPQSAASMLMAAAAAFTGNNTAPEDSQRVAESVTAFVQEPASPAPPPASPAPPPASPAPPPGSPAPVVHVTTPGAPGVRLHPITPPPGDVPAAHVPAPGAEPGTEAHLPAGIDPAHSVGPAPEAIPAPESGAVPDPAPAAEAVPAPAPAPAPPPAGEPPAFGPDAPPTQEFMYPSIGNGCLADGGNVIATAISVAGPAQIPKPGPLAGQTAYVFTAIGTPAPAVIQKLPLNVTWVNLTTGKSGTAALTPNPEINPAGPTTLTAIVETGSGSIMSTIFGQVSTVDKQCNFMPTIGTTVVP